MFIPPPEQSSDPARESQPKHQVRPRNADELLLAAIREPAAPTIRIASLIGGLLGLTGALYITWEYADEVRKELFAVCAVAGAVAGCLVGALLQGVARFFNEIGKEMKRESEGSPSNLRPNA
jgi:hypothetical protein